MDVVGGIHYPLDCHLTPSRFLSSLKQKLQEAGVIFRWSTSTSLGEAGPADEIVVAAGAWSSELLGKAGLKLLMQPGKGYSLTLTKPRQLPRLCSILSEAHVAVTPMGDFLRFGGTMELSGFDREIKSNRVRQIIESAKAYFPEFTDQDFQGVPVWHGFRPVTPDGLPHIGRPKRTKNICVATGHGMMGLSLAPITGRLVSEIVSDERPSISIEALSPDRFS
jgi:D-amino-acid dehydrogenase